MKKTLLTLTLLCVTLTLHALDYRQVIFGNNYENIIEINADDFFEQYPDVKNNYRANYLYLPRAGELPTINTRLSYYRVYEQVIGNDTFFRVLMSFEKYTDNDLLNWQEASFTQCVFYKESDEHLIQIKDEMFFGKYYFTQDKSYQGLEIIERDGVVLGLLWHQLLFEQVDDQEYKGPSPIRNVASYCLWRDLKQTARTVSNNIDYVQWYDSPSFMYELLTSKREPTANGFGLSISSKKVSGYDYSCDVLVDVSRPFMYTIQNAFDGDPATSYVEDSLDSFFSLRIHGTHSTMLKITNGYADGDYYKENNQIKKIVLQNYNPPIVTRALRDSLLPQEYAILPQKSGFKIEVTEITPGTKYNDTALAELDIYIDGIGWLFGRNE